MDTTYMPVIDTDKCNGCGVCITVCSCGALILVNDVARYDEEHKCKGCSRWCGNCELVCPTNAITCPFEIEIED